VRLITEADNLAMGLISPIDLSDEEKLETLGRLDQFRQWPSLDEKRYCLVCGKIISGKQLQVIGGMRGTGPLRIICPTPGCPSIPMDWVLPTDEVLAQISAAPAVSPEQPTVKCRSAGSYSGHECSVPS